MYRSFYLCVKILYAVNMSSFLSSSWNISLFNYCYKGAELVFICSPHFALGELALMLVLW
jgi:hypothetical protein